MYNVIPTEQFKKDVKYYRNKKKFTHITDDITVIVEKLQSGDLVGDELEGLRLESKGHTYKVRVANSDTKSGQSNGYRIIYYAIKDDFEIYLLTVYYKKDDNRIPTDKEIVNLIANNCL